MEGIPGMLCVSLSQWWNSQVAAIRSGGIPRTPELKALSADMKALAAEFSKLWLTRNKPSLLRENLRDLNKARTDLEKV